MIYRVIAIIHNNSAAVAGSWAGVLDFPVRRFEYRRGVNSQREHPRWFRDADVMLAPEIELIPPDCDPLPIHRLNQARGP